MGRPEEGLLETHRISLSGADELRATYLESLAQYEPTEDEKKLGLRAMTAEERADLRSRAAAIREGGEHRHDWVDITYERTFGAMLDTQEAIYRRDLASAKVALLTTSIVAFHFRGSTGKRVTADEVRAWPADIADWLYDEINAHFESVRRRDPKATRSSSTSS